jgi:hypothetical protein
MTAEAKLRELRQEDLIEGRRLRLKAEQSAIEG